MLVFIAPPAPSCQESLTPVQTQVPRGEDIVLWITNLAAEQCKEFLLVPEQDCGLIMTCKADCTGSLSVSVMT